MIIFWWFAFIGSNFFNSLTFKKIKDKRIKTIGSVHYENKSGKSPSRKILKIICN